MALQTRGVMYSSAWRILVFVAIMVLSMSGSLASATEGSLSGISYKTQAFTQGWAAYSHEPSSGFGIESFAGRENTLRMGVNSGGVNGQLEGLQRSLSSSDAVKANLYLEDEWRAQSKDVRIGMGVAGKSISGDGETNVTVEFVRTAIFNGWRVGNEATGWVNVDATYIMNAWNELEFAINKNTQNIEIYINGNRVTQSDPEQAVTLHNVVLTNYNFGTLSNNYVSHWSTLKAGWYDDMGPTIAFITPSVESEVLGGTRYVSVLASDEIALRQVLITIKDIDGDIVRENAPYIAGTDCRLDVGLTGLPDGTYSIEANAKDDASNESGLITRSFIIDTSAPEVSINSPEIVSNVTVMSGTVVDAHPHHYYFAVKNGNGEVIAGPETVNDAAVSSWQWDTTAQADGLYVVVLTAEDMAGNKTEITKEVAVDNTAPIVTLDSFRSNPISGQELTFSGDVDDGSASIVLRVDGIDYPVIDKQNGRWSYTFADGLGIGKHAVMAVASDGQGNVSSISSSPLSAKDITVVSPVFGTGMGPVALETKPLIDTAQLFQTAAAVTPQDVAKPSLNTGVEIDILKHSDTIPAATESPSVAFEPTENGWKILGILWYWWAVCVALITGGWLIVNRWWRPKVETLTD